MVDWTDLRLRHDCFVDLRCEVEYTDALILLQVPVGFPHPTGTLGGRCGPTGLGRGVEPRRLREWSALVGLPPVRRGPPPPSSTSHYHGEMEVLFVLLVTRWSSRGASPLVLEGGRDGLSSRRAGWFGSSQTVRALG